MAKARAERFVPDPDDALLVEVATRVFGAAYYGGRMPVGGLEFDPPLKIGGYDVARIAYRASPWSAVREAWVEAGWVPNEVLLAAVDKHRLIVVGTFGSPGHATWEVEPADPVALGVERYRTLASGPTARSLCQAVTRCLAACAKVGAA